MKRLLCLCMALLAITSLSAQERVWYDPMESGLDVVNGRGWGDEHKDNYYRLPERMKEQVRGAVWSLSRNAAGLSVRFYSNSPSLEIKFQLADYISLTNMVPMGSSGVDLYAYDKNGRERWCAAPEGRRLVKGESRYIYKDIEYEECGEEGYLYELFLPLYNTIDWLKIGVEEGATLRFLEKDERKPIIVYGTSIAQGASASRAGMAWTALIKRWYDTPLINLGFSGNGRLEEPLMKLICEVDAAVYILDCIPNMEGFMEHIYPRTIAAVEMIRQKSNAPIILCEHGGYTHRYSSPKTTGVARRANDQMLSAYKDLKKRGIKGLYYITNEDIAQSADGNVDGWHPNDIGMREYADAYDKILRKLLKRKRLPPPPRPK